MSEPNSGNPTVRNCRGRTGNVVLKEMLAPDIYPDNWYFYYTLHSVEGCGGHKMWRKLYLGLIFFLLVSFLNNWFKRLKHSRENILMSFKAHSSMIDILRFVTLSETQYNGRFVQYSFVGTVFMGMLLLLNITNILINHYSLIRVLRLFTSIILFLF